MGVWITENGRPKLTSSERQKRWHDDHQARMREKMAREWHSRYITKSRLQEYRLWTTSKIKEWLPLPTQVKGFMVWMVEDVKKIEQRKEFQEWIAPRLEKKRKQIPEFEIPEFPDPPKK